MTARIPCAPLPITSRTCSTRPGRPGGRRASAVTHRAIVNRLAWMQRQLPARRSDVVLQKTPATFDVSVWELFWPLLVGARLVIAEHDGHRDPRISPR